MFDALKRLTKHSVIYGLGSLFQSLVGFILIPVYTRYLTPAEFGLLEILNTILLVLTMILSLGFASAILKVHERDCQNVEEKKKALGTMYLFVIPFATFITLVFAVLAKFLAPSLLGSHNYTNFIYLVLTTNLMAVFLALSFALLRVKEKSFLFAAFSFLKFIFVLVLNLFFVVKMRLGILGILMGNLSAQLVIGLFFLPVVAGEIKFAISRKHLYKLWIFGSAIIPASLSSWVMDLSDRYFLKHYSTMSNVGLYSLGYKIGMLVSLLLVIPFQLAWPTVSFSVAAKNNVKEIYARVLTYFLLVASFFALFLSLFAKPIVKIIAAESFMPAYTIIPLVAFSYVFYGIHFVLVPGLHIKEKSKYYPLIVVIPAFLNLILNYFAVPRYGMMGAALTTLFCFILVALLGYLVTNRFYPVIYEWKRILKIVFSIFLAFVISSFFKSDVLWKMILYDSLILLFFPFIIFGLRFFEKKEIDKVKEIAGRLRWRITS